MSLDTVLKIGRTFKETKNNFRYFSYLYNPKDTYRSIFRVQLPVKEDFSFDWENISLLTDEKKYDQLFELRYKTSGSDSTVKYLYGDIFYEQITGLDKKGNLKNTEERGRIKLQKGDTFKAAQKNIDDLIRNHKEDSIQEFVTINEDVIIQLLEMSKDDFDNLRDDLVLNIKKISKKYESKKPIKLIKKYLKIKSFVELYLKGLEDKINELPIIQFRESFKENRILINTLLKNSNAFEEYLSNPNSYKIRPVALLNNKEKLNELKLKYILNNSKDSDLEKILGKNFNKNKISDQVKSELAEFTNHAIFIHFSFEDGNSWYEDKETWNQIMNQLVSSMFSIQEDKYVLDKSIYRTIASGNEKNDIQFPNFKRETKYKSQYFSFSQIEDLLYGLGAYKSTAYKLKGTDLKLTLLPKGDNLSAEDYENFINKRLTTSTLDEINQNAEDENEPIFKSFFEENEEKITSFDLLIVNTSGNTDRDLIEISGVKKSLLDKINIRIRKAAKEIVEKKRLLSPKSFKPKIENAFQNILGSCQADKKGNISFKVNSKYEAHLLKVLPRIYSMNYYQDKILLPSFIEKIEFATRSGKKNEAFFKFNDLKYDLEFLLKIQNAKNDNFMEIVNSDSYKMGLLLGKLAKDVSLKINSFEKNYVGNLTRRIGRLDDFIRLKNDIMQKLINHVETNYIYQNSYDLDQLIKTFDASRYHKDLVAFGFFESYFRPMKKK